MKNLPLLLLTGWCLLLTATPIAAQSAADSTDLAVYQVEPLRAEHDLAAASQVWVDESGTATLADARRMATEGRFRKLLPQDTLVRSDQPHWLRVRVQATDTLQEWWLLLRWLQVSLPYTNTHPYLGANERVEVYVLNEAGQLVDQQRTGYLVPAREKAYSEVPTFNSVPLTLPAGAERELYLRIHNQVEPIVLSLALRDPALGYPFGEMPFSRLVYLMIAAAGTIALYNFLFFFFTRDPAYLCFSLFSVCLAAHYPILHPTLPFVSWFVPNRPELVYSWWILLTHASFIFFLLFARYFVQLPRLSRLWDRILLGVVTVGIVYTMLELAYTLMNDRYPDSGWIAVVLFVPGLIIALRIFFFPSRLAKMLGAGAIWLMVFTILGFLSNTHLIELPINPWPVGQMGLLLIYAVGLAYKIQLNERARAEADHMRELDAVKSRFFANISHEFRTPLTLILNPLKKIEEEAPAADNDQAEVPVPLRYVQLMRRNGERLLQLVNQLLDLARLDSGTMQLQVREGDVMKFLRVLVFSFESLAERRQIHYRIQFAHPAAAGFFDADKLEKIVVNLLSNAFKFTPERGTITVEATVHQQRLRLRIQDTGPGMDPRELDRIFDRFYQVEGTADQATGTGIGLALVKELVDLHRGQISVESMPGQGTTFKASLPLDRAAYRTEELAPIGMAAEPEVTAILPADDGLTAIASQSPAANGQPIVLIVEDNTDLRQFIAETLTGIYYVLTARNGREGLEAAREHLPDLVISDVMMPEMDGFELCRHLKTDERTSHIPLILLTAKAGRQHKLDGLETGADAYLTKPFDAAELRLRVEKLIEQRRHLRERFSREVVLQPKEVAITSADERFLNRVMECIEANLDNEYFSVEDLASAVSLSRSQLHRKLTALCDQSPNQIIRNFRLQRAKELLENRAGTVSEIAFQVGYGSLSYFTKSFKQQYGVSPSELMEGGKNQEEREKTYDVDPLR